MDPASFRRDPWLRTSGYHLLTWSLLAFVLELRRATPESGGSASLVVALVGGTLLSSLTHERRVGKMAGIAAEPLHPRTPLVWNAIVLGLVLASAATLAASRPQWLFPVWMLLVGSGFVWWGVAVGFRWYLGIGVAMTVAALLDVASGFAWVPMRLFVLGALLPAAGLLTNYRYLLFRPS